MAQSLPARRQKIAVKPDADITQAMCRETGLAHGLVDYKVCAIDNTWSELLFCKRAARTTKPAGKR